MKKPSFQDRIMAKLAEAGPVELTITDVQSWFAPAFSRRQTTHAVNKLHRKGLVERWDRPARGKLPPRFVTTTALLPAALARLRIDIPDPVSDLHRAFGMATHLYVQCEPAPQHQRSERSVVVKPGVVTHTSINLST